MRRLIFLYTVLILAAGSAMADDYPSHPIRLIVPFAPGGAVDPIARLIANPLGERLGKPIVIYDRGGAGGSIGMDAGHLSRRARVDAADVGMRVRRAHDGGMELIGEF